jgi:hypothetical protein
MNPEETTFDPSSSRSHTTLLHDDSVHLFDAGRTLFGALITACLFLAAQLWL